MKRILSIILSVCLLLTMGVSVSSAGKAMTQEEFIEVLRGIYDENKTDSIGALANAYRYVSAGQIEQMKKYNDLLENASVNTANYDFGAGIVTKEEVAELAKSVSKIMTFPTSNTSNDVTKQISSAGIEFYTSPGYDTLEKITDGALTRNALGRLVFELRNNLREIIADPKYNVAGVFAKVDPAEFIHGKGSEYGIYELTAVAMAKAFNVAPENTQLDKAKDKMLANGMLIDDGGEIAVNSPFIKIILSAFDYMNEVEGNYNTAAVAANTVIAGVMDVLNETSFNTTVYPNNHLGTVRDDSSFTFEVMPETALGSTISITNWLDFAQPDNGKFSVSRENGKIKISGKSQGTDILRLYRNTIAGDENDSVIANLFMELTVKVTKVYQGNSGGGANGVPVPVIPETEKPKVETPQITVDENNKVIIITPTDGATIHYTTDGSEPTIKSEIYTEPFDYEDGMIINAIGVKEGYIDSDKASHYQEGALIFDDNHLRYVHGDEKGDFNQDSAISRAEVATIFARLATGKMYVESDYEITFTDVPADAWYTEYIKFMTEKGVLTGYEDGSFRPNAPITRAEFAAIVSRVCTKMITTEHYFEDVPENHWARTYISNAVARGWFVGYEDGTFHPDNTTTRAEAVTLINRVRNRSADKAYITANSDSIVKYHDLTTAHWAYYDIMEASMSHDHYYTNSVEKWSKITDK